MRLTKKTHLGKTGVVRWLDACGHTNTDLKEVLKQGFVVNETMGKITYIGKVGKDQHLKAVIVQSESSLDDEHGGDFTLIWLNAVVEFREMRENGKLV